MISKTAGAIVATAIIYVPLVFAGATFDCVVQPGPTTCMACSDCTVDMETGKVICGRIRDVAQCATGMVAQCSVTTDNEGNTVYHATCATQS